MSRALSRLFRFKTSRDHIARSSRYLETMVGRSRDVSCPCIVEMLLLQYYSCMHLLRFPRHIWARPQSWCKGSPQYQPPKMETHTVGSFAVLRDPREPYNIVGCLVSEGPYNMDFRNWRWLVTQKKESSLCPPLEVPRGYPPSTMRQVSGERVRNLYDFRHVKRRRHTIFLNEKWW